ncbi:MAG: hypothetical protein ABI859_11995 [Pseudomonadota bacterium]
MNRTIREAILSGGTGAAQIADALIATCARIDTALTPIIGSRGVAALSKRSIHLAGQSHPWLLDPSQGPQSALDLVALRSGVAAQNDAEAAAGGELFLHTFSEVLARLVGASLTEQLLRSVWARPSSSAPAQDISS